MIAQIPGFVIISLPPTNQHRQKGPDKKVELENVLNDICISLLHHSKILTKLNFLTHYQLVNMKMAFRLDEVQSRH